MKKISWLLMISLVACLCGCGKPTGPDAPGSEAASSQSAVSAPMNPPAGPLTIKELRVEFPRDGTEPAALMAAVRELPEAMEKALAEEGVIVEEVSVTMGASAAATALAVEEGGVDLAFLPVEKLAQVEQCPEVLLLAGTAEQDLGDEPSAWNGEQVSGVETPGQRMLLCTAPTAYGGNLSGRKEPTWEELDHARWGVLGSDSLLGYRAVELWLADHYEGNGLVDLTHVTIYPSWEDLFQGAENGEIDVLPAMSVHLAEKRGLRVMGVTERLYTMAAVVGGEESLSDPRFAQALEEAVKPLQEAYGVLFGMEPYAAGSGEALDAQRRMAVLTGN